MRRWHQAQPDLEQLPLFLLGLFLAVAAALAIHPWYPRDWALENLIVVVALPLLCMGYRHSRFSNTAYLCLFILFLAHELGAHYTYAEVPYDAWFQTLFGISVSEGLGFSRNHYDRLVHFLYGVLVVPALREWLDATLAPQGLWKWTLPPSLVLAQAALYELLEWGAALLVGGDLGQAYLGTQGDPWDAHQDILLALIGSVITMGAVWVRQSSKLSAKVATTKTMPGTKPLA